MGYKEKTRAKEKLKELIQNQSALIKAFIRYLQRYHKLNIKKFIKNRKQALKDIKEIKNQEERVEGFVYVSGGKIRQCMYYPPEEICYLEAIIKSVPKRTKLDYPCPICGKQINKPQRNQKYHKGCIKKDRKRLREKIKQINKELKN